MHKVFKSLGIRFCAAVTAGALLTASLVAGAAGGGDYYAQINDNVSKFKVYNLETAGDFEISFDAKFELSGEDTHSVWYLNMDPAKAVGEGNGLAIKFYSYGGTQRVKLDQYNETVKKWEAKQTMYETDIAKAITGFVFKDWHKYTVRVSGSNVKLLIGETAIIDYNVENMPQGTQISTYNYKSDKGEVKLLSAAYDNIAVKNASGEEVYAEDFNDREWISGVSGITYEKHPEADTAAPDFSNAAVSVAERRSDGFALSWNPASDNVTPAEDIVYKVYASETPVTGPEGLSGLEPAVSVTGETKAGLSGLSADTPYYIAVTAADKAGNTALWYSTDAVSTTAPNTTAGKLTITADVGVAYVLSIPSSADSITSAGDHSLGTLYAETLRLDQNGKLTVSAQYDGLLTRENGGETLAYALKSAAPPAGGEPSPEAFEPIVFTNGSGTGAENGRALYAAVTESDWNAAAAGIYTDTIVFRADYTAE